MCGAQEWAWKCDNHKCQTNRQGSIRLGGKSSNGTRFTEMSIWGRGSWHNCNQRNCKSFNKHTNIYWKLKMTIKIGCNKRTWIEQSGGGQRIEIAMKASRFCDFKYTALIYSESATIMSGKIKWWKKTKATTTPIIVRVLVFWSFQAAECH